MISQFGIVTFGRWTFDLEALGVVDWLENPDRKGIKPSYSRALVDVFDLAARIAKTDGAAQSAIHVDHLLVALWSDSGLMGELRVKHGISSAERARDHMRPEQAAEALGLHAQTVRACIRPGKLPAMRVAGNEPSGSVERIWRRFWNQ